MFFLVQSQSNNYKLFKNSKMTNSKSKTVKWLMTCSKWLLCFLTCSKLEKSLIIMTCSKLTVLNKAIQSTFFKSQKSKNRRKSYLFWKAVANRAIHVTFLSLKKIKKRVYGNYGSIFACDLEKCPGSLYLPPLTLNAHICVQSGVISKN